MCQIVLGHPVVSRCHKLARLLKLIVRQRNKWLYHFRKNYKWTRWSSKTAPVTIYENLSIVLSSNHCPRWLMDCWESCGVQPRPSSRSISSCSKSIKHLRWTWQSTWCWITFCPALKESRDTIHDRKPIKKLPCCIWSIIEDCFEEVILDDRSINHIIFIIKISAMLKFSIGSSKCVGAKYFQ